MRASVHNLAGLFLLAGLLAESLGTCVYQSISLILATSCCKAQQVTGSKELSQFLSQMLNFRPAILCSTVL